MSRSIIIIDDDDDLLESIAEHLKLKGFDIVGTGRNGLEAVQLYEEYRPDIVLLDLLMPNYDGIYALEHIKRIDFDAKVIVLTGHYNKINKQKIKPFNVTKVLEKPCSIAQLESLLKSMNHTLLLF